MRSRKKLILALVVIFTVNIALIALIQNAEAIAYRRGSSGG